MVMAPGLLLHCGTGHWWTMTIYGNMASPIKSHTVLQRHSNILHNGLISKSQRSVFVCCCFFCWFVCFKSKCVIYLYIHQFKIYFCRTFTISLSEHGATSLGPAVLASVAVASRYPGSKVRGSKAIAN